VGIGTTNPAQKFVVANATNGQGIEIVPGTTGTLQSYDRNASAYVGLNIDTLSTQIRSINTTIFKNGSGFAESMRIDSSGNVGINTTNPGAKLDIQPTTANRKVTRIANDVMSTYFYNTKADAVLDWTCSSYHQAEVVITANATNGGDYNNIYIRGIWSNNHTSHHWDELERVGFLTGSTFTITVGQNGAITNSGKLSLAFDYTSGDFSQLNVRVTDFYGTHAYTIT
jgi:hypothetical protein